MTNLKSPSQIIEEWTQFDDTDVLKDTNWLHSSIASVVLSVLDRLPCKQDTAKIVPPKIITDGNYAPSPYSFEPNVEYNKAIDDCRTAITKYADEIEKGV